MADPHKVLTQTLRGLAWVFYFTKKKRKEKIVLWRCGSFWHIVHEALCSIPSTPENLAWEHMPVIQEIRGREAGELEIQGNPEPHSTFEASLIYTRPCLKTTNKMELIEACTGLAS